MSTKPAAPPPPAAPVKGASASRSPTATVPTAIPLSLTSGTVEGSDRIVVYGTGGIGKSTLAAYLPAPVFLDVERSTKRLPVSRDTAATWTELRGKLAGIEASPPSGMRSLVIDSATVAQQMACEHVVAMRRADGNRQVESIEDYGWGKGWTYAFDEFTGLLADLDRIGDKGFNICLIAHDVATEVPNPMGEDFIRWEPHLAAGDKRGRSSIRARVKEWADHVIFIGYDVDVRDGKGRGHGSRTIYTQELPTHLAKSRTKLFSMPYEISDPGALWRELGIS